MNITEDKTEYNDQQFEKLDMAGAELQAYYFENCQFSQCNFSETKFNRCKFIDCEFLNCNLSLIKVSHSSFVNVVFEKSKLLGVNWCYAAWPTISLPSPINFYQCDISLSTFYELDLTHIIFENCKAHEVDFREADMTSANFSYADLFGSQFVHTNLSGADFTEAVNYQIDVLENKVKNATFSFPEVVNLLSTFELKVIGLDDT